MRKYLKLSTFLALFSWPSLVLAAAVKQGIADNMNNVAGGGGYAAGATEYTLSGYLGVIIKAAMGIMGVVFLILTLYASFLWMTAQGDEKQVEKAQAILRMAIIGIVLIASSYAIYAFVFAKLLG